MLNIYNYFYFLFEKYICPPLFDMRVYPFEFMDAMYSYDLDIDNDVPIQEKKKMDTKRSIMDKILDFKSLENDEHDFLATLPNTELMQFIRIYNANIDVVSENLEILSEKIN